MVDVSKKHIFIWVPGTGGHEVHPAFESAVKLICGEEDAQILVVDYPATWDMSYSVPKGVKALKQMLLQVQAEMDHGTQELYVGGSSQGSWVISDTYKDRSLANIAKKTVLFGHPGVAESHDHIHSVGEKVWEINHPDDVVTFGWAEDREKMVKAFSRAQRLHPPSIAYVVWLALRHPVRLARFIYLIMYHKGLLTWNTSPHDYSQMMPMAVYWMIH